MESIFLCIKCNIRVFIGKVYIIHKFCNSFIYLPRQNPYFCLKCLKIKGLRDLERDLYPCYTPIFYGCLERQDFVNGLPSIKKILDNCNRSYILVITELTTPLTFMRNPVRLFYPIKIKKEVHKTGSLFCGYWKRNIWK